MIFSLRFLQKELSFHQNNGSPTSSEGKLKISRRRPQNPQDFCTRSSIGNEKSACHARVEKREIKEYNGIKI